MYQSKRIMSQGQLEQDVLCYWKDADGLWMISIPKVGIGCLAKHVVIELSDGTITVSPSILLEGHDEGTRTIAHGYLERGIWRDC